MPTADADCEYKRCHPKASPPIMLSPAYSVQQLSGGTIVRTSGEVLAWVNTRTKLQPNTNYTKPGGVPFSAHHRPGYTLVVAAFPLMLYPSPDEPGTSLFVASYVRDYTGIIIRINPSNVPPECAIQFYTPSFNWPECDRTAFLARSILSAAEVSVSEGQRLMQLLCVSDDNAGVITRVMCEIPVSERCLYSAIRNDCYQITKMLINDSETPETITGLLLYAAQEGMLNAVRAIMDRNHGCSEHHQDVLCAALVGRHTHIVQMLVERYSWAVDPTPTMNNLISKLDKDDPFIQWLLFESHMQWRPSTLAVVAQALDKSMENRLSYHIQNMVMDGSNEQVYHVVSVMLLKGMQSAAIDVFNWFLALPDNATFQFAECAAGCLSVPERAWRLFNCLCEHWSGDVTEETMSWVKVLSPLVHDLDNVQAREEEFLRYMRNVYCRVPNMSQFVEALDMLRGFKGSPFGDSVYTTFVSEMLEDY